MCHCMVVEVSSPLTESHGFQGRASDDQAWWQVSCPISHLSCPQSYRVVRKGQTVSLNSPGDQIKGVNDLWRVFLKNIFILLTAERSLQPLWITRLGFRNISSLPTKTEDKELSRCPSMSSHLGRFWLFGCFERGFWTEVFLYFFGFGCFGFFLVYFVLFLFLWFFFNQINLMPSQPTPLTEMRKVSSYGNR